MNENNILFREFTSEINVISTCVKNKTSFINNRKYEINLMVRILFY